LALAARDATRARALPSAVLATAAALGAWQTLDLGYPSVPRASTLLVGAAAGLLAAALLQGAGAAGSRVVLRAGWLGAAGAAAAGLLLAASAPGLAERHAGTGLYDAEVVGWAADQASFEDGDGPIAMAPLTLGVLAGDRLQHRLELVQLDERCFDTRRRLDGGWVVQQLPSPPGAAITRCLGEASPELFRGRSFRVLGRGG
jgi:hypothetical protein